MKSLFKSLSTAAIWVVAGVIVIVTNADGATAGGVVIALASLAAAAMGTSVIWADESTWEDDTATEKQKRTGSSNPELDTLMRMMTDEEREAFKQQLKERLLASTARLADDDGEVSLGELLADDADQTPMSDTRR
ncbi:MAG: hypothetical protein AAF787_05595 [Chloroflexota bacterium]